jgi:CRP-like cAMP-binding protein
MTEGEESKARNIPAAERLAKALPRLTPGQVAQVSPKLTSESFTPGAIIIHQGQPARRFFIIVQGQAEVWHKDLKGSEVQLNSLGPGDYFGETGLIQGQPRNATVRASEGSSLKLLVLGQLDFEAMMEESKASEMHMAQEMVQRLIKLANAQTEK